MTCGLFSALIGEKTLRRDRLAGVSVAKQAGGDGWQQSAGHLRQRRPLRPLTRWRPRSSRRGTFHVTPEQHESLRGIYSPAREVIRSPAHLHRREHCLQRLGRPRGHVALHGHVWDRPHETV